MLPSYDQIIEIFDDRIIHDYVPVCVAFPFYVLVTDMIMFLVGVVKVISMFRIGLCKLYDASYSCVYDPYRSSVGCYELYIGFGELFIALPQMLHSFCYKQVVRNLRKTET